MTASARVQVSPFTHGDTAEQIGMSGRGVGGKRVGGVAEAEIDKRNISTKTSLEIIADDALTNSAATTNHFKTPLID